MTINRNGAPEPWGAVPINFLTTLLVIRSLSPGGLDKGAFGARRP